MLVNGKVAKEVDEGFWVFVPSSDELQREKIKNCKQDVVIDFDDGVMISTLQRKKIYALLREIAVWWADDMEYVKEYMKQCFLEITDTTKEGFSLADTDKTTARLFISFLLQFILLHGIPTKEPLWQMCEDIEHYIWACLMTKRCCICGGKTEIHHVDAVGMGRNRKEIIHVGMRVLPLCRKHHCECHKIGNKDFMQRYIIKPMPFTAEMGDIYSHMRKV